MKNLKYMIACAAVIMMLAAICAPAGICEETSDGDVAFMGAAGQTPEEIIVSAMEIYSWFTMSPLDVDPELVSVETGLWRVADEALCHAEVVMRLLDFTFSPEIVQDMLAFGTYTVIDGVMYGDGVGRGIDPRIAGVEYTETYADEERVVYTVTVNYHAAAGESAEPDVLEFVRERVNGQWLFTQFPFFW